MSKQNRSKRSRRERAGDPRGPKRCRRLRLRPQLEKLEDRRLLAAELVSVTTPPVPDVPEAGSDYSTNPAISGDGRFIAFQSHAPNLVSGGIADTNGTQDIFVRDLEMGTTSLISINSDGTDSAMCSSAFCGASLEAGSHAPAISDDGRYVAFVSSATDLVKDIDIDVTPNVFVRDRDVDEDGIFDETGSGETSTTLLSIGVDGTAAGVVGGTSTRPVISGNGEFVAFASSAPDMLVDDVTIVDTNGSGRDVYRASVLGGAVTRINVDGTGMGTGTGGGSAFDLSISADGGAVTFASTNSGLVSAVTGTFNDTNARPDIFVGRGNFPVEMVSANSAATGPGSDGSREAMISRDGRHVAFFSSATNLAVGVTDTNLVEDLFVRDLKTKVTTLVSRNRVSTATLTSGDGATPPSTLLDNDLSAGPAISETGRFIAFRSSAENLLDPSLGVADGNLLTDIFLFDRDPDRDGRFDEPGETTTTLVTVNEGGTASADHTGGGLGSSGSSSPSISRDGRYVAFSSTGRDLIPGGTPLPGGQVYLRDTVGGITTLVSETFSGATVGPSGTTPPSRTVALSGDGSRVAFQTDTPADDLDASVTDPASGSPVPFGEIDVFAATPPTDIVLLRNFASGFDEHVQSFRVRFEDAAEFDVGYYLSTDDVFDAGDTLLGTMSVTDPDDLIVDGNRRITATIGAGAGEIPFPGVGSDDLTTDYFILAVGDHTDAQTEFDADSFNEDNTDRLRGVYHVAGGPVFAHGAASGESITASVVGDTLELSYGLNSSSAVRTFTYELTDVTDVRIRTHAGDDVVTGSDLSEVAYGGEGSDALSGGGGDDMLFGGPGKDRLVGGEGADTLNGGSGPDELIGGPGDDIFFDGPGDDLIDVGPGDDIVFATPGSDDIFIGSDDIDILDFSLHDLEITLDLDSTAKQRVDDAGNTITLLGEWQDFVGTALDDRLTISPLPGDVSRRVDGGGGLDQLIVDAGGNNVINDGTKLSFPGTDLGDIFFVDFERVFVTNSVIPDPIIDDRDAAPDFTAPGFICIDFGDPPCTTAPQQGFDGSVLVSEANDGNTATWTFNDLPSGSYLVSTTWTAGEGRALSAPFTIRDGGSDGSIVAEVAVDQELEPGEFEDQGSFWQNLALVHVTGNTLTVELTDVGADATANDINEFVIADAIRIESIRTPGGAAPIFIDDAPNQPSADRVTPATVREVTGLSLTNVALTLNQFQVDLGGIDNFDFPPSATGSRSINWDEITDLSASPEFIPLDLYNTTFPRGLQLHTGGEGIQVSKSPVPGPRFANLNNTYPFSFTSASQFRLMSPIGDNVFDVSFFVPGTTTPAAVKGFGAVFTDVDNSFTTRMQFFDAAGNQIYSRFVQATAGEGSLSFTGVSFEDPVVARVRVTAGEAALLSTGSLPDVSLTGGEADLVVMDNFVYGEPQALPSPMSNAGFSTDCSGINGAGFFGDQHFCSAGQQSVYDTTDVMSLTPGTYVVSTTWEARQLASDDVSYVIDNGGEQTEIRLSQQLSPDDFSEGGHFWERLAKVTVVEGQSPVITTSSPSGGTFTADAVRFDRAPSIVTSCAEAVCWGSTVAPFPEAAIDVDTGDANLSQRVIITNSGLAPLNLANFMVTGQGYTVDASETATVVPPLGSTTIEIHFSSTELGMAQGQLSFESNDFDHPTFTLDLITDVVTDNTPPTVAIVTPDDGATFVEGTTVNVSIDASDDVRLREVDLIVGGILQDTITSAPFEFPVTLPTGVDSIQIDAIARDVAGNTTDATPLTINLLVDQAPVVQIANPPDGQGVVVGSTIQVTVDAVDDVSVERVELLLNGEVISSEAFAPFAFDVSLPGTTGDQHIQACATDSSGQVTCQTVTVTSFASPIMTVGKIVIAPDAGSAPRVRVVEPGSDPLPNFFAYDPSFTGGVRVATGDINGDTVPDIITGAGPGGGPHVKVFDGVTGETIRSFFAYDPSFTGGVFVASGDITGDGRDDIITGPGAGGGPHVRVFDGVTGEGHGSFNAFDPGFLGGIRVATGDLTGDGQDEIIVGAGPGGGPRVRIFDGHLVGQIPDGPEATSGILADFFAFSSSFTGGVFVAAADLNHDGLEDVVLGADQNGSDAGGHVKAIDATILPTIDPGAEINGQGSLANFFAYDPGFTGGVRVATGDINGDGNSDIVTAAGPGSNTVRVFDGVNGNQIESLELGTGFQGSAVVSASLPIVSVVNLVGDKPVTDVVREGDDIVIRDQDGNELLRRPADDPQMIRLNAPADRDDLLVLRTFGSNPLPKIVFDGGVGGFDAVRLQPATGSSAIDFIRVNLLDRLNTSYSTDRMNPRAAEFLAVDLEPIDDRLVAVDREFAFADTDDNVLFDTGVNAADNVLRIDGNHSEVIDYEQPSGTTTVMLGAGTDRFAFDVGVDQLPTVDGEAGVDTLVTLASQQHLDLTAAGTNMPRNIEVIDLVVAIENELTISGQNVLDVTDAGDTLVLRHDANDTVNYAGDGWQLLEPIFVDGGQRHVLANGDARVESINGTPFQNPLEATDANRSGATTSLDALQILNFLGQFDTSPVNLPPPTDASELPSLFPDVNGSGTATALDALQVINFVAAQLAQNQGGEGESLVSAPAKLQRAVSTASSITATTLDSQASIQPERDTAFQQFAPDASVRRATNAWQASTLSSDDVPDLEDRRVEAAVWDQALTEVALKPDLQ